MSVLGGVSGDYFVSARTHSNKHWISYVFLSSLLLAVDLKKVRYFPRVYFLWRAVTKFSKLFFSFENNISFFWGRVIYKYYHFLLLHPQVTSHYDCLALFFISVFLNGFRGPGHSWGMLDSRSGLGLKCWQSRGHYGSQRERRANWSARSGCKQDGGDATISVCQ